MFLRMTAKDGRALASTNMHTLGTYATEHTRTYALKIINTTQSDLRTTNNFFYFQILPLTNGTYTLDTCICFSDSVSTNTIFCSIKER